MSRLGVKVGPGAHVSGIFGLMTHTCVCFPQSLPVIPHHKAVQDPYLIHTSFTPGHTSRSHQEHQEPAGAIRNIRNQQEHQEPAGTSTPEP